jgi:hypothetical protein
MIVTPGPVTTPWNGLHWVRLKPDDPLGLVTMVRRWSRGYVAVGSDPGRGRSTPVWSSKDGATWRPIAFDTSSSFWPGMMILDVAPVPDGVVAIGRMASDCGGVCPTSYSGPVVSWASSDGYRWSPHVIPEQWLSATTPSTGPPILAAGPRGLVVGIAGSARFATSTNGVRWQPADTTPYPRSFSLVDIEGTTSGYVAVGQNGTLASGRVAAESWSADGRDWSMPAALPGAADVGRASTADAILVTDAGAIAIGRTLTTPGATLWWRSPNGRQWSILPAFAPFGASDCVGEGCGLQPAGSLVADGTRIVGVGFDRATRAWMTIDGASWSPLDMFGDVPRSDVEALALLPSGVLVTSGGTSWLGVAVSR